MDQPRPARWRRWKRPLLLIVLFGVLSWGGSKSVGYLANLRAYHVPSGSMAPAILPGDRIVVDLREATPRRGEIWTFDGPTSPLIKRVIGLPGETIEVGGGKVLIDGKPLAEPYATTPMGSAMSPVRLGPDEYFLMGDSRNASADSRAWGPVSRDKFIGRAEHRYWPSHRIGPLR